MSQFFLWIVSLNMWITLTVIFNLGEKLDFMHGSYRFSINLQKIIWSKSISVFQSFFLEEVIKKIFLKQKCLGPASQKQLHVILNPFFYINKRNRRITGADKFLPSGGWRDDSSSMIKRINKMSICSLMDREICIRKGTLAGM